VIFGFPTLKGGSSSGGDPLWASVALLLKFDGTDGSTTLVDSSSYADNKTAGAGLELDTAQSKFGGSSLLAKQRNPGATTWTGTKFARPAGTGITAEGWFRRGSVVSATATPHIFMLFDSFSNEVVSLAKYDTGNQVECRFAGSGFTQHTYTPGGDGWVYWMVRIDNSGNAYLYLGTTQVKTGTVGTWSGAGTVYIASGNSTDATAITFWLDETRVTMADRGAPASIPTDPFPVGLP